MTLNEWNYMMLVAHGVTRKSTSSIPNVYGLGSVGQLHLDVGDGPEP